MHTAANGALGMAVAAQVSPNIILTDIHMPEMDGLTFVKALRSTTEYTLTPIIILTDEDTAESRMQGFRLGADDFVGKGTVVDELEVRL